jgi:hypothetical protein
MAEEAAKISTEMTQPVIIDLGKQKKRILKNLKVGKGKLWDEVFEVVEEVKDTLGADADGKVLVPIIMIYREKPKRKRSNLQRVLSSVLD